MAAGGQRAGALAEGAEKAGNGGSGRRCAGMVPWAGAGISAGDQPGAAEGDGKGAVSFEPRALSLTRTALGPTIPESAMEAR